MSYFLSPASEPPLTTPDEAYNAIRGLKVSNTPVYSVQGTEGLSPASGFLPHPYLQLSSPHPSFSPNVEAGWSDLYP